MCLSAFLSVYVNLTINGTTVRLNISVTYLARREIDMRFRLVETVKQAPRLAALVTCAVCALSSSVVQAAMVTENLTADLSGFLNIGSGPAAPNSAVDGSFTVTFNTSSYIAPTTSGLTVNSFTGTTISSPIEYAWNPTSSILSIGASSSIGYIYAGQNDVVFQFNLSNLNAPTLSVCSNPGFSCGTANGNSLFYASGYTLAGYPSSGWLATVANGVSVSAPELSAGSATTGLTLLLGGLAVLAGRRRSIARDLTA